MELILQNDTGSINMSGSAGCDIRITSITGLGALSYERRLLTSYDFDGAIESGRRMPVRSISISGDLTGGVSRAAQLSRFCSEPFKLIIITTRFQREINVNSCEIVFSDKNRAFIKFAMSLSCDDPYFYDANETKVGLYYIEKLISDKTVLPAVFSERVNQNTITVSGDRSIEPIITILGGIRNSGQSGEIVIENLSTDKTFTLAYTPQQDELITIDVSKRTIKSSINGNIIEKITDDSFLSDLELPVGDTLLKTMNYGSAGEIGAYIIYKNKYIEALV